MSVIGTKTRLLGICGGWLLCQSVLAQSVTPVVQMAQSSPDLTPGSASELLYMLEQSRQEISELRGQVEQLQFELQQTKKQARDRYIDLDRRVSELSERGAGTAPAAAVTPAVAAQAEEPAETSSGTAAAPATAEARKAYDAAYQLIRNREYEKAVDALHQFINDYPESDLTPNAYYWLGEVYLVIPKLEQAKQSFIVVVSRYKDHRKAPDAFYKLGVTYDRLGSTKEAKTFLEQTIQRFPGSSSAGLAEDYLKKLK